MGLADFFALFRGGRSRARVDLLRRYELLHHGIAGTMSNFYKARDNASGAIVGLKVLDPKKVDPIESRYKGLGKAGEGEIGSLIVGPNVVKTLDWGVATDGRAFIVEEFLEGMLLHALLSKKIPLPSNRLQPLQRHLPCHHHCQQF